MSWDNPPSMDPEFECIPLHELLEGIKAGTMRPTSVVVPSDFIRTQAEPLVAAIEFNQSVTHLDVSCNNLGDAIGQKLGNVLRTDKILQSVAVRDNGILDDGFCMFADGIEENDTCLALDLSCNLVGAAGSVRIFEALAGNRCLRSLSLTHVGLPEAAAAHLSRALLCETVMLEHLDISHNSFGEGGCQELAKALADNRRLLHLDISNNCIRDAGAVALAEALRRNPVLETLRAGANFIKAAGAAAIGRALPEIAGLATLDLSKNALWEGGAPELAGGIAAHSALRCVVMQSGNLRLAQTAPLGAALSAPGAAPALTELDLAVNAIEAVGVEAICKVLSSHTSLRSLNLRYNGLKDAGAARLAAVLENNAILERLDLQHNGITDVGAARLMDALVAGSGGCAAGSSSALRHLDLARNPVGAPMVEAIAGLLRPSLGQMPSRDQGRMDDDRGPLAEAVRLLELDFCGADATAGAEPVLAA